MRNNVPGVPVGVLKMMPVITSLRVDYRQGVDFS